LLRKGQVVRKLDPDIIANTGVNGLAFKHIITNLSDEKLINTYEDMAKLQLELKARGLYSGEIDGQLGRGTRSAIVSFEQVIGLNPTGLPLASLLQYFGEHSVRPSYTFSNAQGSVTQLPENEAQPRPAPNVPVPVRRPESRGLFDGILFNPFGE
jgi:peptidoglycan hydrolase-like protein with peptidoglycan-binding domain